jgi:hypothetical protein
MGPKAAPSKLPKLPISPSQINLTNTVESITGKKTTVDSKLKPDANASKNSKQNSGNNVTKLPPINRSVAERSSDEKKAAITTTAEANGNAATPADAAAITPAASEPEPEIDYTQYNGKVVLIYEQYNESFSISKGSLTHEEIDNVYSLSFVMPNCMIHLSKHDKKERFKLIEEGVDVFIEEKPRGTYQKLKDDQTYYLHVEQQSDQLAQDQEKMRCIAETMDGAKDPNEPQPLVKDDGRVMESCSCVYGNPCVDEYGCKDWINRRTIATLNGWKGF